MNVSEIRLDISQRFSGIDQEYADGKYGIKMLLRRTDIPTVEGLPLILNCFTYVFGQNRGLISRLTEIVLSSKKIDEALPFSLATYGSSSNMYDLEHVGIVTPDLTVISKWGTGHVFEHPPEHISAAYGPVKFYRVDMEKIYGYCHSSLITFLNKR
ncbi:MAG: hypothetical protein WC503_00540 [Candidatus Shapirobacteria bacterium]